MRSQITQTILLLLYTVIGIVQAVNNTCCTIGRRPTTFNNPPNISSPSMLSGLFLNMDNNTCKGEVVGWNFCYYQRGQKLRTTTIQAGIWRETDNTYELVNGSAIDLPITDYQDGIEFVCRCLNLNSNRNQTVDVEDGDIVGMYMYIEDESGEVTTHMFETANSESSSTIMKVKNATDINSMISKSMLEPPDLMQYSLYLEAITDNMCVRSGSTCMSDIVTTTSDTLITTSPTGNPDIAITTTTSTTLMLSNTAGMSKMYIGVVVALGGLLLLLSIIIVALVFPICRRTRSSGPVLITKLKTDKKSVNNVAKIENTVVHERNETGRPQPTSKLHQSLLSPPVVVSENYSSHDHSSISDSGARHVSPIFTVAVDDEEQLDIEDEGELVEPKKQQPSRTISQKIALLPKLDLRRSQSAAESMNLIPSNPTSCKEACFTSSSEYPYVLHAFEVVGRERVLIGSLPNMSEVACHASPTKLIVSDNGNKNANMEDFVSHSNKDGDEPIPIYDEPSYNYKPVIQHEQKVTDNFTTNEKVTDFMSQDYHYEEYPSNWTPTAKLAFVLEQSRRGFNTCLSPEYDEVSVTAGMQSAAHPAQVLSLKQSINEEQSGTPILVRKQKPPVKPRKKKSNLVHAETPNKYMKLLQSTTDEHHNYTCLLHGSTELNISDGDAEQDYSSL